MESLAADLRQMQRTPLADTHVRALRRAGETVRFAAGEMVAEPGDPMDRFLYVEDGEIEVVNPYTGDRYLPNTLGPTQFLGEIAFLTGGAYSLPMRACRDTVCIAVDRREMLDLMAAIPEMSDIVITVFAARRRRQIEDGDSTLKLIGTDVDRGIRRIAAFAGRNRIPFQSIELGSDEADAVARACAIRHGPAVIFGRDQVIADPTPAKVAQVLGLALDIPADEVVDVLIVGGGPAGVAAGVYAGAEGLSAVVVEDLTIGGQAGTSSRIENYMGFPTGISGADLVWRGEVQAMKFGTRFAMPRRVSALDRRDDGLFCATLDDGAEVCARAVVVATGVQYRRLAIDGLERFEGAGIYYAATEIEARWCRGTEAVVIGGGNSAGQAAMHLSRSARHVHLLVRGASLAASMSDYLSARLEADPQITVHYRTELEALHGDDHLDRVTIRDKTAGQSWELASRAVFVMVGAAPNTDWLAGHCALDPRGFVRTGAEVGGRSAYETSTPGIFAVGDVRAGSVKRVASSVGEGSVAISSVWQHVADTRS
ncbi:cyclic nucleotide-binding domain-containing protein [Rhodobacteraceae bacterium CCMM004]|nr:cyclic nucleotide-binding domain-containing protein [Rhodobacteraceae bacterium CCMM004]